MTPPAAPLVDGPLVRPYVDRVPDGWPPAPKRARPGFRGMIVYDRLPRCKGVCRVCRLYGYHRG
ncbi:hypothetical protein HEK616_40290 [Streptomyces nigrescens]|uniref:Radical SAM protein n=1 Tax=Streptomyces nigrescens TaxID=1920 RepID=A0ABM7ZW04_STRNI|nr:hypothetical protein HEK616_40290 [Streptomyces nigrescens]